MVHAVNCLSAVRDLQTLISAAPAAKAVTVCKATAHAKKRTARQERISDQIPQPVLLVRRELILQRQMKHHANLAPICSPAATAVQNLHVPAVRQQASAPVLTAAAGQRPARQEQHTKQMSGYAVPIQLHTPAVFLMISEGHVPTVLNVQEDCALRAILLPDNI